MPDTDAQPRTSERDPFPQMTSAYYVLDDLRRDIDHQEATTNNPAELADAIEQAAAQVVARLRANGRGSISVRKSIDT